jgi:hypothetical protein
MVDAMNVEFSQVLSGEYTWGAKWANLRKQLLNAIDRGTAVGSPMWHKRARNAEGYVGPARTVLTETTEVGRIWTCQEEFAEQEQRRCYL